DVLTIGMNRAVELLADAKSRPTSAPLKALGDHPDDGKPVEIMSGRYGPYVKHGRTMASLPKGTEPDAVDMAKALELIAAKAAKGKGKGKGAKKSKAKTTKAKKTSKAAEPTEG
ncbi:MAG: topoisomerase C-terminal repeat-containing protein, partial [Pseudomonadota bacterium]